jgi:D-sedoheptulose 7-phosphate isomerase
LFGSIVLADHLSSSVNKEVWNPMEDSTSQLIDYARKQIDESREVAQLSQELLSKICSLANRTAEAIKNGRCVFFCGNGGSAADAQHLAAEFVGRFRLERRPLPSMALTTNTSLLTAIANDYGYEQVFSRQVHAFAKPNDILFGISTSGNSPNVVRAMQEARTLGVYTVGLTGRSGGNLKECADVLLNVPSDQTPRIQEAHILLTHIYCDLVERLWVASSESAD